MECIKHSETSDFMCGSHAKKRAVNRRFATAFVTALFGDPIFKNRSGTASEKTVPPNVSEFVYTSAPIDMDTPISIPICQHIYTLSIQEA